MYLVSVSLIYSDLCNSSEGRKDYGRDSEVAQDGSRLWQWTGIWYFSYFVKYSWEMKVGILLTLTTRNSHSTLLFTE